MITFERSFDEPLIREIITHPRIYPWVSDDYSVDPQHYKPNPAILYLIVKQNDNVIGLFALHPQNAICWEIHTCLLPMCHGQVAAEVARQASRWIFQNTQCKRIVTNVPANNRLALRYAERAGMTQYGLNPKSYQKNGELLDQIMLGLSREGICQ